MRFEIIRIVDGRWFDAEGYERTPAACGALPADAGYYAVFRRTDGSNAPRGHPVRSIGPFTTEGAAGEAALLRIATESGAQSLDHRTLPQRHRQCVDELRS